MRFSTSNPLTTLTPRQAEACGARLPDRAGRVVPLSRVAGRLGITKPSAYGLIVRGLRRLESGGFDAGPLRRRLALN